MIKLNLKDKPRMMANCFSIK